MKYKRPHFEPDFNQLLNVLNRQIPDRPTLFEFFMNERIIQQLSGVDAPDNDDRLAPFVRFIKAFANGGYDYVTISGWRTNTLAFPKHIIDKKASQSQNQGSIIYDRKSFDCYQWPNADDGDYDLYHDLKVELPMGMKLIATGNGGILENAIDIVGFENLCLMTLMDEELTTEIFNAIGQRFLRFYEIVASIDTVGACIINDDWGYKTQTILPPDMLRRWVFPWCEKIVQAIHNAGKPAILHSCGQLADVMHDVIHTMQFDAKHSFEDNITPVEQAITNWGNEIAILGGIDMDYLSRQHPDKIRIRARKLLQVQKEFGAYALGSGNSISDYVPDENYLAMIDCVND